MAECGVLNHKREQAHKKRPQLGPKIQQTKIALYKELYEGRLKVILQLQVAII